MDKGVGAAVHGDWGRRELAVALGVELLPGLGGPGLVVVRDDHRRTVGGVLRHKGADEELGGGPRGDALAVPGAEQPPVRAPSAPGPAFSTNARPCAPGHAAPPQHGVGVDGHDVVALRGVLGGLARRGGFEDAAAGLGRHADAHGLV